MPTIYKACFRPPRIKNVIISGRAARGLGPRHQHPRFASGSAAAPTSFQPSFARRSATFVGRGILFTALGFIMAAAPAYASIQEFRRPPTDAETVRLFVPADAAAEEVESFIDHHPVVAALRADPNLHESRPHMKMPSAFRPSNFTGGTLLGPGRLTVAPFEWKDTEGRESVQIFHVGKDVCGHPGIVHGGMIATMLDEGLARCSFAALPHHVGVTASLTVNYKAPAKADSYLVLRAETTKVEGRKAWVKGRIETLAGEGNKPTVLAEAEGLFVSPKQAAIMERVYPI